MLTGTIVFVSLLVGACGASSNTESEEDIVNDGRLTLDKRLATRVEAASGDMLQLIFLSTGPDGLSVGVNQNGANHPGEAGTRVEAAPFVVEVASVSDDELTMNVSVEHTSGEALAVAFREEPGSRFLPAWGPTALVALDDSVTVEIVPEAYDGENFAVTARGASERVFTDLGVGDTIEFDGFTIEFTHVYDDGLSIYATDPAGLPIR